MDLIYSLPYNAIILCAICIRVRVVWFRFSCHAHDGDVRYMAKRNAPLPFRSDIPARVVYSNDGSTSSYKGIYIIRNSEIPLPNTFYFFPPLIFLYILINVFIYFLSSSLSRWLEGKPICLAF